MFKNAGFTLSELVTTVGIFSILAAIAIPNINAQREVYRLNGAARQVLGDLMWARTKAVQENNPFIVSFPNTTSLKILDDDDSDGTEDVGVEETKTRTFQDDYAGVTLAKGITPITLVTHPDPVFSSRGTAGALTDIIVTNPSGTKTITVNRTGSVRIN